jgi:hypothetical protein
MRKGTKALKAEAEIGLVGELVFLVSLLGAGIAPFAAVEAWVGPLDGIQDFMLGTGAIEIKTTLATIGFTAKISSLEQLDDSLRKPLFIAGERLSQTASGLNLPSFVSEIRQVLSCDASAEALFGERLLAAGYLDAHADSYYRCFTRAGTRIIEVVEGFPRIVPRTVPEGISRVAYEIDLDQVGGMGITVIEALEKLGVI